MQYLFVASIAFVSTVLVTFVALKLFPKIGLMDRPQKYGLKRAPIPYYGGLILFAVFLGVSTFFVRMDAHFTGLIIGALIIVFVSFLDDVFNIPAWIRLLVQIFVGFLIAFFGIGIQSITNPLGGSIILDQVIFTHNVGDLVYSFSLLGALFTILWIVGMMNTMNFLDGLNGLPSGVSCIAFTVLFFLAIRPDHAVDQTQFALMSVILAASTFAFWLFDFYPAKILMGDTGSMFLGYMLAILAIFSGGKVATVFLVMGFPLLDAAWVIVRRILAGQAPWKGDLQHFHHRLLTAGLSPRRALFVIYFFSVLFGVIALFLGSKQKLVALVALLILMLCIGGLVVYYSRRRHV